MRMVSRVTLFKRPTHVGAGRGNRTPDSTLGRSRFATKPYPPVAKRYGLYLTLAVIASLTLFGLPFRTAWADGGTTYFDASLVAGGKTLVLADGAKFGVFPNALTGEANVTWMTAADGLPAVPAKRQRLGLAYRLNIDGAGLKAGVVRPLAVAIPFGRSSWIRQVWQYDIPSGTWTPLRTTLSSGHLYGQAEVTTLNGYVAILEDRQQLEGTASYYCVNVCSTSAQHYIAATNAFPVGTTVRVRNLQNGKTLDVKIVSTWAGTSRHVIDLHVSAFAALGGTRSQGLIRVNVSIPQPKVLGVTTAASKIETIPNLSISGQRGIPFPSIAPRPFLVLDQGSRRVLAEHRADEVVPIASLTKLMTAAVFLDTKTDLRGIVTYAAADQTPFGYLRVAPGDTMYIRDLFYSLLVGSANNAATALVRSTGLSREEFVARMNAKARAWGLGKTRFVDVHGLDPANVSTAREAAIMAGQILHEYEPVRFVTVRREYSFRTINTGVAHRLVTTDKILGAGLVDTTMRFTGGKTGYLDEAKYTYVTRAADKITGAQVIVALMRSESSAARFNDAASMLNWAFRNHQWAP